MAYFFKNRSKARGESDEFLVDTYKRNQDPECIGILYERYARLVFAVCMKYLKDEDNCKDAVNRIFEKLFSDLKKYQVREFRTWIHSVARNYCFSELQKEKQAAKVMNEYSPEEGEEMEMQPEKEEYSDDELKNALNSLENHQRICVELFYLHHKRYAIIADLTGYSLLQVKSFIQNGKRNLKIYLTRNHEAGRIER